MACSPKAAGDVNGNGRAPEAGGVFRKLVVAEGTIPGDPRACKFDLRLPHDRVLLLRQLIGYAVKHAS